jgi:glutaredoxin
VRPQITLYTRGNCCLCEEMKEVIRRAAEKTPLDLEEIDVDSAPHLAAKYGDEVPVLFIDGRKAFKYRLTVDELKKRLEREIA